MAKYLFFDFRCPECNLKSEHFVKPEIKEIECPKCTGLAVRCISAPTIRLPGTDPDFPRAYDQWEKKQRAKTAEDKRFHKNHGVDKKHHSYGS